MVTDNKLAKLQPILILSIPNELDKVFAMSTIEHLLFFLSTKIALEVANDDKKVHQQLQQLEQRTNFLFCFVFFIKKIK